MKEIIAGAMHEIGDIVPYFCHWPWQAKENGDVVLYCCHYNPEKILTSSCIAARKNVDVGLYCCHEVLEKGGVILYCCHDNTSIVVTLFSVVAMMIPGEC